jgi:hypothetical protein
MIARAGRFNLEYRYRNHGTRLGKAWLDLSRLVDGANLEDGAEQSCGLEISMIA